MAEKRDGIASWWGKLELGRRCITPQRLRPSRWSHDSAFRHREWVRPVELGARD